MGVEHRVASRWRPAVSRVLSLRWFPSGGGDHSSRPWIAPGLERRPGGLGEGTLGSKARLLFVLLRVGFTMRPSSPRARCALTAPFHPYRTQGSGGLLSVALSFGSPRLGVTQHPALGSSDFPPVPWWGTGGRLTGSSGKPFWGILRFIGLSIFG